MHDDPALVVGFAVLAWLAAGAVAAAVIATAPRERRARISVVTLGVAVLWLGVPAALAASGELARFDRMPPSFVPMMLLILVSTVALGRSRVGERLALGLPLWLLVGSQAFRLPLELMMHRAAEVGLMPVQMSYAGQNFDIVTGASALLVAALSALRIAPRWLPAAWNGLGFVLLVNIVSIAVASTPLFAAYGDEHLNIFVFHAPYVWLPTVLVPVALLGHVLVLRRLRAGAAPSSQR